MWHGDNTPHANASDKTTVQQHDAQVFQISHHKILLLQILFKSSFHQIQLLLCIF
jgi:hypothetical protein